MITVHGHLGAPSKELLRYLRCQPNRCKCSWIILRKLEQTTGFGNNAEARRVEILLID